MVKRIAVSVEASFVLFIASALVALAAIRLATGLNLTAVMLAISVPAFAALGLTILGAVFSNLSSDSKVAFPVNITFPVIYCLLMLLLVRLAINPPSAIEVVPPKLEPAAIWSHWKVLVGAGILGSIALTVMAAVGKRAQ